MYMLYFPFFGNEKVARDKKMKKTKKNNKVLGCVAGFIIGVIFSEVCGFFTSVSGPLILSLC